ncbi:DUF6970 domain-containing protein [Dyadobacter frigoris]|uniref:DUF6970 domain-containing protein n=1 Tax=Dyadobacter frigoris TaxID=2576211 RepID=UPI001E3EE649|nr:hypothetical protein [Dyadobacter frigoris]
MKYDSLVFLLIFFITGCGKEDVQKAAGPDCIVEKINSIRKDPVWNPPAKVFSYTYNGTIVYYIPPRCCDIPSELLDENCNPLCSPDGGPGGGGDGKCPDFFEKRSNEKLVWIDERK